MNNDILKIINTKLFRILYDAGFIDEISVRNFFIKKEYEEKKNQMDRNNLLSEIAEKYNISTDAVKKILYTKRIRKSVGINFIDKDNKDQF